MRENVGRIDRIVRSIIGPSLMVVGYTRLGAHEGRVPGLVALVSGALLVESAITRVCPMNALFGLDTRSSRERIRDFRGDINEQSDRIAHDYGQTLATP